MKNIKRRALAIILAIAITVSAMPGVLTVSADYAEELALVKIVTVFDALEVLKYLVGMDSKVDTSMGEPTIHDALEILKMLVGMRDLPCLEPDTFYSLDEFIQFLEDDKKALSHLLLPKNIISGSELERISYDRTGSHKVMSLIYKIKDYVYNDKLDEYENDMMSTIVYEMSLVEFDDKGAAAIKQFTDGDLFKLLSGQTIDGNQVYYNALYKDGRFLRSGYVFIKNDQFIYASLPAVEGLDEYGMVKYLEMVSAVG